MKTAQEIIGAAIDLDRADFRKRLIAQAEMHDDNAMRTENRQARQGAESQRNACLTIYDFVGAGDVDGICAKCGTMVVALNVAAKMLDVSPSDRTQAAMLWDDANKGESE